MKTYMIQVQLGSMFEDLFVKARDAKSAMAKAKALVAKDDNLKTFRHRFANFVM